VIHGPVPPGSDLLLASPPYDFPNLQVRSVFIRVLGKLFIWQSIVWKAFKGDFDAAVLGDEVKYLSNLVVAVILKLRGRPVLLWGFGYHQYDQAQIGFAARLSALVAERFKGLFYRLATGYLTYTEHGAKRLRSNKDAPRSVSVLWNTVDIKHQTELKSAVKDESLETICSDLGVRLDSVKLVYFGRLITTKRVDLLVQYARKRNSMTPNVDIIIFGTGAEESELQRSSQDLPNVVFHRHDDMKLSRALRVSAAVVIPGFLGLAVTHAFAHGIPMLTRASDWHSPEIDYLKDGTNGLILPAAPDLFFQALDDFVGNPELQQRLAKGAIETSALIDMDHMVRTFDSLVVKCLEGAI